MARSKKAAGSGWLAGLAVAWLVVSLIAVAPGVQGQEMTRGEEAGSDAGAAPEGADLAAEAPAPGFPHVEKPMAQGLAEMKEAPRPEGWEEEAEAARVRQEPPDGVWWIDEAGRAYFLTRYPKEWGYKSRAIPRPTAEKMVELADGRAYLLAGEDEELLYLKQFRPADPPDRSAEEARKQAELEEIAAAYRFSTAEGDRLVMRPFSQGLPTSGQWRNGFDLADMNGDGRLDIVHGPPRKGRLDGPLIFLNEGDGNWTFQPMEFPSFPYDYGDVAVADFNGDGRPDIAMGIHLRGVVALVADGPESFRLWNEGMEFFSPRPDDSVGSAAAVFSSRTLTVADWNGDGRMDVVALGEGPRPASDILERTQRLFDRTSYGIRVYLNGGDGDGNGRWSALDVAREQRSVFGDSITVQDFDADGAVEALIGSNVFNSKRVLVDQQAGGVPVPVEVPEVRPMAYVSAVAAGDVDGDGHIDAILAFTSREADTWRRGIEILYRRGEGWESRLLDVREGRNAWSAMATGDLDGDGALDLVALDRTGESAVFLGDGEGFLVRELSPEMVSPEGNCNGYAVRLADLDGDGRDEIVQSFAGERSPLFAPGRCPGGGAILAWDPVPAQ